MVIHVMNDIFEATPNRCIIVQQVNCKGKMGAGLALAIRKRYPQVYEQYMVEHELGVLGLGYVSYVLVNEGLMFANMCSQDGYGRGRRFTDYDAMRDCLEQVRDMANSLEMNVVIPKNIGCGLAGGDWKVVSGIIEEVFGEDKEVSFVYNSAEKYNEE